MQDMFRWVKKNLGSMMFSNRHDVFYKIFVYMRSQSTVINVFFAVLVQLSDSKSF